MTNEQFIHIIKLYQENDCVHELTCICGAGALDAKEKEGKVILYCNTCGHEQELDGILTSIILNMYLYSPFGFEG